MALQKIFLGTTTGDKTGDGAKIAGEKINAAFDYLENKIDSKDRVLVSTGFTQVGSVMTINAGWQWMINGITYTNPVAVEITFPLAETDLERIDNVVATTSNTFMRIPGVEAVTPIAPLYQSGTVIISFSVINDAEIAEPDTPINNTDSILKSEQYYTPVNSSGVLLKVGKKSAGTGINFLNAATVVGSLEVKPTYFNRLFDGVIYSIKNSQSIDIVFNHLDGTGNVLFSFPTATNFTLKPNEIFQCKLRITSSNTAVFDYIGVASLSGGVGLPIAITDVTGLTAELATKVTQTEIDSLATQLLGGAPADANTLKELNDKILAVQAIIGGTTADGDALVNTVAELLAVFATFPEGVDLVTLLAGKVNTTDVYNALDCIVAGKVADARQLKVLNDLIVALTTVVAGKEDASNKSQDIEADKTSTTKFGSVKAFYDWCVGRFQPKLVAGTNISIDNTNPLAPVINATAGGGGDMTTTTDQTVSGIKTFLAGKLGFRNVANTFTSFFTNANTASRTYTYQNRDGTLLDNTDLSTINSSIATKMANPTGGIASYLPKFLTATTMGLSRLFDNGTYFGIGTANAPTKDFTLGNQTNRVIGVEPSDSTTAGRDLDIEAGKTVNYSLSSNFNALGVSLLNTRDICEGVGNDMFIALYGGIYKQTNGTGGFALVSQNFQAHGVGVNKTNGTVYAVTTGGDIYKQTNGTGSFVAMGQTFRGYRCVRVHQNGNVYVTSDTGIFMQTAGSGSFNLISSASTFYGLAISPINGDVYVNDAGSGLYVQSAGSGSFNFFSSGDVDSRQMAFTPTGDLITFKSNKLYKRVYGTTPFVAITEISGSLFCVGVSNNTNVYTSDYYIAEVYMQNNVSSGVPNLDGGTLRSKAGPGKGTGKSWYEIWTGQKTTSGTNMQVLTKRVLVDEMGNFMILTDKIFADNAAAIAGGLPLKTIYWTTTGEMRIVV
jgi:hypothetical protein